MDIAKEISANSIARGLEAMASRYRLNFPDDMEKVAHQSEVYDARYAQGRLQVARIWVELFQDRLAPWQ